MVVEKWGRHSTLVISGVGGSYQSLVGGGEVGGRLFPVLCAASRGVVVGVVGVKGI